MPGYPVLPEGLAYGGDYNPEQWPEEVWQEDVRLMREAGVTLVTVGVFNWGLIEPREGEYDFSRLDRILDLLHSAGVYADLATPTSSPPTWFRRRYPGSRLVDREGHVLGGGSRHSFCPSSPDYAAASERVVAALAARYAGHPAVAMWHVHNEYGWANAHCYCPTSAEAFRAWLRERYGDVGALNAAWGTTFWGLIYGSFDEVEPPVAAPVGLVPGLQLDFMRFSVDAHIACFRRERDTIRRFSDLPVTTNFMIPNCKPMDYWRWAAEVDVVANDHYLDSARADSHIELAMAADLTRSVAGGRPWMLMEHSTGAVNWQPRNLAKRPGEMRRNTLAHVARGSDSAMFFQWRASRYGAEKFHSAMVPHAGTDSGIWRDVVALGADLRALAEVRGARVTAEVAVVWDWESYWALEFEWRPSADLRFRERIEAYYEALWREHVTVDFVHPSADLSPYRLVVAPSAYLLAEAAAKNLHLYVEAGGHLLVSYFSGIVDENDTIHPGPYPGGCATCSVWQSRSSTRSANTRPSRCARRARWCPGLRAGSGPSAYGSRVREPYASSPTGPTPAIPPSPGTTWERAAPGMCPPRSTGSRACATSSRRCSTTRACPGRAACPTRWSSYGGATTCSSSTTRTRR